MITSKTIKNKINEYYLELGNDVYFNTFLYDFKNIEIILNEIALLDKKIVESILLDLKSDNKQCKYFAELIEEDMIDYTISSLVEKNDFIENEEYTEKVENEKIEPSEKLDRVFKSLFENKTDDLKRKINPIVLKWIDEEVPKMSIEDYNVFLFLINSKRKLS